jgi:hypothetical protein
MILDTKSLKNNNMKKYLCCETINFYDNHGDIDEGSLVLSIVNENDFEIPINTAKDYWENHGEFKEFENGMDQNCYPQDGYSCSRSFYKFREINEDEEIKYREIIQNYNNLINSFKPKY